MAETLRHGTAARAQGADWLRKPSTAFPNYIPTKLQSRLVANPGWLRNQSILALRPLTVKRVCLLPVSQRCCDCKYGARVRAKILPRLHFSKWMKNCKAEAMLTHSHTRKVSSSTGRNGRRSFSQSSASSPADFANNLRLRTGEPQNCCGHSSRLPPVLTRQPHGSHLARRNVPELQKSRHTIFAIRVREDNSGRRLLSFLYRTNLEKAPTARQYRSSITVCQIEEQTSLQ